jgi:hypothetical protein
MFNLLFVSVFKFEAFISRTLRFFRRRRWRLFLFDFFRFLRYWSTTHFERSSRVALAPNYSSDLIHFLEHIFLKLPDYLFFPDVVCFCAFHSFDDVAIIVVVSRTLRLDLAFPNLLSLLLVMSRFLDQ